MLKHLLFTELQTTQNIIKIHKYIYFYVCSYFDFLILCTELIFISIVLVFSIV